MALVTAKELLEEARIKNTAALAFVCIDYNEVRAVITACERTGKPAMCMLLPEYVTNHRIMDFAAYIGMASAMAKQSSARIALHLDHSYDEAEAKRAIDCGFTSIMFDASRDDLETNIARTRAMVEYAHARGVAVESELGAIGLGRENAGTRTDMFTKPETTAVFCERTGVDSLAIAIGNAHGDYDLPPKLDLERLDAINAATETPLVLHGGSGIPDDQLVQAFSRGINKFNYGTDVKRAYGKAVWAHTEAHRPMGSLDILGTFIPAQDTMVEVITAKLALSRL